MMKRILALLLAMAMLLSVSAVFAEAEETAAEETVTEETAAEETAEEPAAEETAEPTPTPVPDTLLVTVNGYEIRENNASLQAYLADWLSQVDNPDEDTLRVLRMYSMNYMLEEVMLLELANKDEPVDEETLRQQAQDEWNEVVEQFMAALSGITEDSTEEERTEARTYALSYIEMYYGYTEDMYISEVVKNMPLNTAYTALLDELKATQPDLTATDEEIQQAYDDMVAEEMEYIGNDPYSYEFYTNYYGYELHYIPEGYRGITHILLKVDEDLLNNWIDLSARLEENQDEAEGTETEETEETAGETEAAETAEEAETAEGETAEATPEVTEEPVTEEMVEAARQAILDSQKDTIDEIMAKLAEGASFESLIAEYGTDPGMQQEEYLKNGYSVHKDSIVYDSLFTDTAAALENVGDVSDPIVTQFGIHILYYLRDIPAGAVEMTDEEKESLRSDIEDERINLAFSEYFDQWQADADIVWTEEGEGWKYDEAFINALYSIEETEEEAEEAEETAEEPAEEASEAETAEEPAEEPAEESAEESVEETAPEADAEETPAP